jgi:hypothetical protein
VVRLVQVGVTMILACGPRFDGPGKARPSPIPTVLVAPSPAPTPTVTPTIYRVGEGVTAPHLTSKLEIKIPDKCRMSEYAGAFIFEATITETGEVRDIQTTRRPKLTPPCPELEEECRRALSGWKYGPALRDGKPVPVYLTISILLHGR